MIRVEETDYFMYSSFSKHHQHYPQWKMAADSWSDVQACYATSG